MICNTGNALTRLFDEQKRQMSVEDLEWFSGLTSNAILQAENVGAALNALAAIFGATNHSNAPGDDELTSILYGLASQAETVAALAYIGSESSYMAGELKQKSAGQ